MNKDSNNKKKTSNFTYPLIGLSLPLCLLMGYLGGHYLDKAFGTEPILLIVGICLGVVSGYVQLFKIVKRD